MFENALTHLEISVFSNV